MSILWYLKLTFSINCFYYRPKQESHETAGQISEHPSHTKHRLTLFTKIKEHPSPGSNPNSPQTELPPLLTDKPSSLPPSGATSKKSHQRSRSDATLALQSQGASGHFQPRGHKRTPSSGSTKNCLGDSTSGRAFDNGCCCFDSEEARCNSLRGKTVECHCGVSIKFFI